MYDVVVVGGGPAGLYTADQLGRRGWNVAVCEEHAEVGEPVHCTGLVASDTLTRFALPKIQTLAEHHATRFRSPSGYELSYSKPQSETVVVDRAEFDRALAAQAVARGVTLLTTCRVQHTQQDTTGITVATTRGHFSAKLLVIATGASYRLHRELGFAVPARFVQTSQVEATFSWTPEVELYFGRVIAPGSFAWVVPIRRNGQSRARLGLMSDRGARQAFQQFLYSEPIRPRLTSECMQHFQRRPIPLTPLPVTFVTRALVVGDAAGLTKPTTGGGIYYSLLSGELAATTAHSALVRQDYSAEFLSRYQQAWTEQFGRELWWGRWFRRRVERFTDAQIDEAFQLAAHGSLDHLIRERATFNQHSGLIRALISNKQMRSFLLRVMLTNGSPVIRRLFSGRPSFRDSQPVSQQTSVVP